MSPDRTHEFAESVDLARLCGRTFDAFSQDAGYWHASVALRAIDGASVVFTSVEHVAGHWFEVFPIQFADETSRRLEATLLLAPMTILSAQPLWRVEWIEAGAIGPSVGSATNTQYAGRGPVPQTAVASAQVLAGVLMQGVAGQRLLVASSDSAPFNVEIAQTAEAIEKMLKGYESLALS